MISNSEFRRIYVIQVMMAVADAMAMSFMMLYLVTRGFRLEQLLLATTLAFSVPVLAIAAMGRARAKASFSIAFVVKIIAYLIALFWIGPVTVNFIYIMNALVLVFFWVPYNLEFFSYATEKTHAYSGSVAIVIYPLVAMAVPPVAAYIWHGHGFALNMLISIAILAGLIVYVLKSSSIKFRRFDYRIAESLRSLKGYRTLFAVQGFWEASSFVGVPVFTLLFIGTELHLGFFFSYLGVLSVIATVTLARLSDRHRRRTAYLYPTVILAAGATIALAFARTTVLWVTLVGLLSFTSIMTTPFLIAVALDAKVKGINMWAGRELLLNLGRALGSCLILLIYRGGLDYRLAFVVLGGALFLYPLLLHVKRIYAEAEIIPAQPAR
ncbi:MAG: hypothetical protein ABIJ00_04805 [Candidatus Eisenbacteria bacterium]